MDSRNLDSHARPTAAKRTPLGDAVRLWLGACALVLCAFGLTTICTSSSLRAEVADARPAADTSNSERVSEPESETNVSTPTPKSGRMASLMTGLTVFLLAVFVGFEVINKVPPTLHTPLMSGSNAISGITVIGALLAAGHAAGGFGGFLGFLAIIMAMINVVGGFVVTHRMLMMFKRR